jgi:hypothetical protein
VQQSCETVLTVARMSLSMHSPELILELVQTEQSATTISSTLSISPNSVPDSISRLSSQIVCVQRGKDKGKLTF